MKECWPAVLILFLEELLFFEQYQKTSASLMRITTLYLGTGVQLYSLPLQCWNTQAISRIASKLGKPLCLDKNTHERKRISYAHILIEIDTSVIHVDSFEVRLPSSTQYTQYVTYAHLPKFCVHCYLFGHHKDKCKYLVKNQTNINNVEYNENVVEET